MKKMDLRFAVVGAGGGGQAIAGYLALKGYRVRLYNRGKKRIRAVARERGIFLEGKYSGFAPLEKVTADMSRAVRGADVVLVVLPASAHRSIAAKMAKYIEPEQIVVLCPGRTGGCLEFEHIFGQLVVSDSTVIAEAQTFPFASRVVGSAKVRVFGVKKSVRLAALPSINTDRVIDVMQEAFPQFVAAENVLETGLDNIGAIFHPAPTLLNAARIEQGSPFDYYCEGVSPAVAKVLEQIDYERRSVGRAMGVKVRSALEFLRDAYGVYADSLHHAIGSNPGYVSIKAPVSMRHRYISEDVPTSLVPMASLGELYSVATPTINSIIHLACVVHGTDYWSEGRTVERLGLADMAPQQIWDKVMLGKTQEMVVSANA